MRCLQCSPQLRLLSEFLAALPPTTVALSCRFAFFVSVSAFEKSQKSNLWIEIRAAVAKRDDCNRPEHDAVAHKAHFDRAR